MIGIVVWNYRQWNAVSVYILYNHDNYNTKTRIYDMLTCDIYYHRKCTTETHRVLRLSFPHYGTVASYSVTDLGHHWWRQWLGPCSVPSHYLNQWLSYCQLDTQKQSLAKIESKDRFSLKKMHRLASPCLALSCAVQRKLTRF